VSDGVNESLAAETRLGQKVVEGVAGRTPDEFHAGI